MLFTRVKMVCNTPTIGLEYGDTTTLYTCTHRRESFQVNRISACLSFLIIISLLVIVAFLGLLDTIFPLPLDYGRGGGEIPVAMRFMLL